MIWETPAIIEVRMDAEIGSYQEDSDHEGGPFFAAPVEETVVAGAGSRD